MLTPDEADRLVMLVIENYLRGETQLDDLVALTPPDYNPPEAFVAGVMYGSLAALRVTRYELGEMVAKAQELAARLSVGMTASEQAAVSDLVAQMVRTDKLIDRPSDEQEAM
ncbi:MAG: hypothetical protein F4Z29_07420 [Gemmatimonadetes bacterium]|nr:hypothetical protein [Gemmatimonadota bacterium]